MNNNFHNLPHHNQALKNQKVQRFLKEKFDSKYIIPAYGYFWIIMELLHQNKNKLRHPINSDADYFSDIASIEIIITIIDKMLNVGLLEKETDNEGEYYFSPYQRLVKQTKEKHSENLQLKNQRLHNVIVEQEKLIKRLNEKIEFLKSKRTPVNFKSQKRFLG